MKNTALLIIDMQVGATKLTDTPIYRMDQLIETLKQLIGRAREKGVPVFYVQHHNPNGYPQIGSSDWQLIPEIEPQDGEIVIHKSTPDPFWDTSLHANLQEKGIRCLVVAGIQTPYCIDTTCRRAFSLGYEVILVQDGHSTFDSPSLSAQQIITHHNQLIADWFGKVAPSETLFSER